MNIRHSREEELPILMKLYEHARQFMAANGNPNQWGPTNWPPKSLILSDIREGKSYVCTCEDEIVGTFFYDFGKDVEPNYQTIEDGAWMDNSPYGVLHRMASSGTVKGVGSACIQWAFRQCGHLRIDTHNDNRVMQNLLSKNGFVHCGTIYVPEDSYPRLAYEKISV